jgi:uncharacterized protein DUF1360
VRTDQGLFSFTPMDLFFFFVLGSVAVFRLTEMVVVDRGPFHVFLKIRNIFPQDSQLDELVECFYCMGLWMAILVSMMLSFLHVVPWSLMPFFAFSIAGGSVIIYRTIRPRK